MQGVKQFCDSYLYASFASETNKHKEEDGDDVVVEAGPVVDAEGSYKRSHQHKEYRARTKDCSTHQHHLQQT